MKRVLIQDTKGSLKKETRDFLVSFNSQLQERVGRYNTGFNGV
jgi:hypothetical protein